MGSRQEGSAPHINDIKSNGVLRSRPSGLLLTRGLPKIGLVLFEGYLPAVPPQSLANAAMLETRTLQTRRGLSVVAAGRISQARVLPHNCVSSGCGEGRGK